MGQQGSGQSPKLHSRDLIEFGEDGPLSRFYIYREDRPTHKPAAEILDEGLVYLRMNRRPIASRLARASSGLIVRLLRETTLLFRIGVVVALAVLGVLVYQQGRLNTLLQEQIASDTGRTALRTEIGTELTSAAERLEALEKRSQASARVIAGSVSSVVFLQGAYGFRDRQSGRMLRYAVDDDGKSGWKPLRSAHRQARG